jgi:zinc transport system substrate-binding protein
MTKRFFFALLLVLLAASWPLAACGPAGGEARQPAERTPEPEAAADTLNITVSILPQKYFVERVGGDYVSVNVMVGPGEEPHTYEPKPEQLKALSKAAAYMCIRVDFENAWMERIASANGEMLIVDTTQGIERMPMGTHHHQGEEEAEHLDPHIWLSPSLVKVQAQTIYEALVQLDPAHGAEYKANLDGFVADIDALDADIRETLGGLENRKFMVFHPAWGYFARDYELEMIPIEIGGQEPSAAELAALITEAQEEGIKVVFAQPEFSTKDADTIAREIGGEVLLISVLAPDWLDNLRQVAKTFAEALGR